MHVDVIACTNLAHCVCPLSITSMRQRGGQGERRRLNRKKQGILVLSVQLVRLMPTSNTTKRPPPKPMEHPFFRFQQMPPQPLEPQIRAITSQTQQTITEPTNKHLDILYGAQLLFLTAPIPT